MNFTLWERAAHPVAHMLFCYMSICIFVLFRKHDLGSDCTSSWSLLTVYFDCSSQTVFGNQLRASKDLNDCGSFRNNETVSCADILDTSSTCDCNLLDLLMWFVK